MSTTILSRTISLLASISMIAVMVYPVASVRAATCASVQYVSISSTQTNVSVCAGQKVYVKVGTTYATFNVSQVGSNSVSFTTTGSPSRGTISIGSSLNVIYPEKFETRMTLNSVRNGYAVIGLSATHVVKPSGGTPIVDLKPDLMVTGISLNQSYPYDGGLYAGNLVKITYKNNGSEAIANPFSISLKFGPSWVIPQLYQPIPTYLDTYSNGSSAFLSSVDKGNSTYEVSPNRNTTSGLNAYALAPGQSGEMYVFVQEYYGPLLNNGLTITVTTDSTNSVNELIETNNASSAYFTKSQVKKIPGTENL